MANPETELQQLSPQARKRIMRLENYVSELSGVLGQVVLALRANNQFQLDIKDTELFPAALTNATKVPARNSSTFAAPHPARKPAAEAAPVAHPAQGGLAGAQARGEAARVEWVRTGEVVPAKTLADAWGLTPQALGPAAKRGEVFAVLVKSQRYYPKEFLELDRADVSTVCKALEPLSPAEKLVFWKRTHGALAGKTVLQTLSGRQDGFPLLHVLQQARAAAAQAEADAVASS